MLSQDYEAAITQYQRAREQALTEAQPQLATQFLLNTASCYQSIFAYRAAMQLYKEGIEQAKRLKLLELESYAALNTASMMLEMGEDENAEALILKYPLNGTSFHKDARLSAFLQQMAIFSRRKKLDQAKAAFERALSAASEPPSAQIISGNKARNDKWSEAICELKRAFAFSSYSQALTKAEKYQEAEAYALEAFRIRTIYQDKSRLRDALQLAMLSRKKQDLNSASQLLEVARKIDPKDRMPMHLFLLDREESSIHMARGNFASALPSLRSALQKARSWRTAVLPSSSTFLSFESRLTEEIQAAFLNAILQPNFDLNQSGLAEESLWIAEEARFASMRAAQFPASEFANRLPNHYWAQLARYQRLQIQAFSGSTAASHELAQIQQTLRVLEMESGLEIPPSDSTGAPAVSEWRRALPEDEVVFSFYLAEPHSLVWTATRKGIAVRKILGRKKLAALISKFRQETSNPSQSGTSSTGMEISQELFGENLHTLGTTPFWTMVIDQELANLPFAALPAGSQGKRYLIEDHSLRLLPSAIFLHRQAPGSWNRTAAGFADSIYNVADQRASASFRNASDNSLSLSRLPSSANEIASSLGVMNAGHWRTSSWTGAEASASALRSILGASPDIVHLSAHFVTQANSPQGISIALSPELQQQSGSLFGSLDLNAVRTKTRLVVLSGCSSSTGEVVPSIGINGLSRAFLISGVNSVIATYWPTIDTNGPIFPVFYDHLIHDQWSPRAAASALRVAQLKMIQNGGWTSKPAYWAAYLSISKG